MVVLVQVKNGDKLFLKIEIPCNQLEKARGSLVFSFLFFSFEFWWGGGEGQRDAFLSFLCWGVHNVPINMSDQMAPSENENEKKNQK